MKVTPCRKGSTEPLRSNTSNLTKNNWAYSNTGLSAPLALLSLLLLLICPQGAWGQSGRGNITGLVTDASGAVVPGATVTAIQNSTGVSTPAVTNSTGVYNIIQVIPGTYTIKVEKEGFSTEVQNDFLLVAEQVASLNFQLKPGAVNQQVTVNAQGQLLNTENGQLGTTIDEEKIVELPLNGRNPASLVLLTAGTVDVLGTNGGNHQQYTTFPTDTGASANGGRQGSVLYLLDGSYNMDNYHLLASPFPNPDATQEFTVITNNFDSRYGFSPGGVVSIVTKSGTNDWHGDLFEFLRNGDLNAKDYFTQTGNNLKQNQFGGSVGGPIVKDKLFIFGNYQATRATSQVNSSNNYAPTAAMKNGDFSAFCQTGFNGAGLCMDTNPNTANPGDPYVTDQIWTPTAQGNNGNSVTVSQAAANPSLYYPNNYINPATFLPAASKMMALLPLPSNALGHITSIGYGNINNFNEGTVRVDYDLNEKNRISGRMYLNYFNQPTFSENLISSNRSWIVNWQNYSGTWTRTINPHIVNNVTSFYSRMYDHSNSGLTANGKPICWSQYIAVSDPTTTPCSIEDWGFGGNYESGGTSIAAQNFNGINRWTWGAEETLSVSKGKHLIVAGVDVLRQYWYENTDWLALPLVDFNGGPQGQFTGSSWADFLLGDESNFEQGGGESNVIHGWMVAPYITDTIKLKPNLTVTAGLRWEPWIAPITAGGRISMYIPGQQSTRYPNAPLGMVFPGDRGVPSAGLPSDYVRYFDPRFSVAWQPSFLSNTSIRAALGVFATPVDYASWNHSADVAPFSPTYNFTTASIVNGSPIPIIPLASPWSVYNPVGNTSPFPPFAAPNSAPGSSAPFFGPINIQNAWSPHYIDSQTLSWNVSIERQFGSGWMARVAYVGSNAFNQSLAQDQNYGQFFGAGNPANGTRLNPNFSQVLVVNSNGTASYDSLQGTLDKRFSHGLTFSANYTFAHTIDEAPYSTTAFTGSVPNPRCIPCNRSNSALDVPQVFVANFIYQTPTLASWNFLTREALGGWELSGIYRAQTGTPVDILSGQTTAWDAVGNDNPDYAPGYHSVVTHKGNINNYFDAKNFVFAQQGSKGDTGQNPKGSFGPGINNWDMSFSKNFPFGERYRFQFRWEMYNAFNRVTLGAPNNTLNSGQFGLINNTNSNFPARVMQVAGKLYF